jgi:hypothetical protein
VTDQNRTILQWVLGIGILLGGVKVVMDLSKGSPSPPAVADAPKTKTSASDSAAVDPLLPPVGGDPLAPRKPPPVPTGSGATQDNPLQAMQQKLLDIAKDPTGNNPIQSKEDPQTGLLVYVYEIQGLQQAVLLVMPGKPEVWVWQFSANIPPQLFAPQGKAEPAPAPGQGAQALKLTDGPLAGCMILTVDEEPRLRVLKSPGFLAFEAAEIAAAASGSASGKPAPSGGPRKGAPR